MGVYQKEQHRNNSIISKKKVLRGIVNAPWYIRKNDLHKDLQMEDVNTVIKKLARNHEQRLHNHVNIKAIQLLDTTDMVRTQTN